MNYRDAWIEIDLNKLRHNIKLIKNHVGDSVKTMAVIKADAYGHGFERISDVLVDEGIDNFAVATFAEAMQLRKRHTSPKILILGKAPEQAAADIINNDIDQIVQDLDQAKRLSILATELGRSAKVQINIDTGISRYGFVALDDCIGDIARVFSLDSLEVTGIFSHFTSSDEQDAEVSFKQATRFELVLDELKRSGVVLPDVHICNSGATLRFASKHLNMVRVGIAMYGVRPSGISDFKDFDLLPVMSLKAKIARLRTIRAGESVGYSCTYVLPKDEVIATLQLGYADGLSRIVDKDYSALYRGKGHELVGRVCMDAMMLRIEGVEDAKEGDVVTLIGDEGGKIVSLDEFASAMGLIPYELMCRLKLRLERVYLD